MWKKVEEVSLRAGYRRLLSRKFQLPDGRIEEFTIKDEGRVACILALTPDQRVILAKQYRPGPEKILLELPGGGIEVGESSEDAACRELLEETGYRGEMRFICEPLDDAYSTIRRFVFVATNCVKVQEPQLDENEFIEVVTLSLAEFRDHLRGGQLTDIEVGYLGLDALGFLN